MKNITMIDCQELDRLVTKTYGKPYCYQQQDDCKDRGCDTFTVPFPDDDFEAELVNQNGMGVSFKAWLERDPKTQLADTKYDWETLLWWERNFYPNIQILLNDLCEKGLIPEGEITIHIDW